MIMLFCVCWFYLFAICQWLQFYLHAVIIVRVAGNLSYSSDLPDFTVSKITPTSLHVFFKILFLLPNPIFTVSVPPLSLPFSFKAAQCLFFQTEILQGLRAYMRGIMGGGFKTLPV